MPLVVGIHHVQLAIPPGREAEARAFYAGVLGLREVPKPATAGSGGAWFEDGELRVHLGVEESFRAAKKAHPAFLVDELGALLDAARSHGLPTQTAAPIPGFRRAFVEDPFGNRIELLERQG